jgi:flagellar basal-body rod modification protein FlgD
MSVAAISSSQAAGTPTAAQLAQLNSSTGAIGGQTSLSESDFLQLLTTQLQNQDPLQPMSDTDFIAQMATFSQLSAQNTLNTDFSSYSQTNEITTAQSYIGQSVTVSGAAEGVAGATGTVTGVTVSDGAPMLTIGGVSYALSDVTAIQPASTSSTASASASASASSTAAAAAAANAATTPSTTTPGTVSTAPTAPAAAAPATTN